jgi:hypothetical protein
MVVCDFSPKNSEPLHTAVRRETAGFMSKTSEQLHGGVFREKSAFNSENSNHFCNNHLSIKRSFDCMDATDNVSGCKFIIRFLKESSSYERIVSKIVGSPVHVDMIFHQPGTDNARFSYSAFMGEKFSMTLMSEEVSCSELYENIVFDISDKEHTNCISYVNKLLDKTSYNYDDAMMMMPMFQNHPGFTSVMFPDIDSSNPVRIKRIFCSQAVVIVMRECLGEGYPHENRIGKLNSRLVSPNMLRGVITSSLV